MATSVNAVLAWLMKHPGPHGPSEIGRELGLGHHTSAAVCACLKPLVEMGTVRTVKVRGVNAYEWTGVTPEGVYMG